MSFEKRVVVAIPVRDEEAHIGACLAALARQSVPAAHVLLLLNNCTDRSLDICMASGLSGLRVIEKTLPPLLASAGEARRLAISTAANISDAQLIFTTDADAVPPDNWIEANLVAFEQGAEVVCGMAHIQPADAAQIPARLHQDHRRESACLLRLDALDALIDPDPIDPWPRHQQHSGASIAMTTDILKQAGGAPHVASGEDRALIARLRAVDARIRHAQIPVVVSGRLEGRAAGGMAETIKRRICQPDTFADEACEPAVDAYRRALAKARLREAKRDGFGGQSLGTDLLISRPILQKIMREKFFGTAWAALQKASPVLQRRRVRMADLTRETAQAQLLYEQYLYEPVFDTQFTGDTQIAR